jgi:flagellar biosynthesis/type III secretory pathway chaperone
MNAAFSPPGRQQGRTPPSLVKPSEEQIRKPTASDGKFGLLIDVAKRLCAVLAKENEALAARRAKEVEALIEEKTTLTRVYEQNMQALAQAPDLVARAEPEVREELKGIALRLDELVKVNGRVLKASLEANQRVLKAVIEAAKRRETKNAIYDKAGSVSVGRRKGLQTVSVSVNRTL